MIIIAEGCDNVGKDYLLDKFMKSCPDSKFKKVHCTRDTPNNFEYFRNIIDSPENIAMSRAWYGQFCYQTSEERQSKGWLTYEELHNLEFLLSKKQYMLFNVVMDPKICLHLCKKDSNDKHYTLEYIEDIMSRFDRLFKTSELEVTTYHNDFIPSSYTEEISDSRIDCADWSSLPKIVAVDFDGTLVTNDFPEVRSKNDALFNELLNGKYKDYKKILWTTRTGKFLKSAVTYCNSNGLYFDAVNENIPEVKLLTSTDTRKVFADVYLDDKSLMIRE
jgi:thymidylate kinase